MRGWNFYPLNGEVHTSYFIFLIRRFKSITKAGEREDVIRYDKRFILKLHSLVDWEEKNTCRHHLSLHTSCVGGRWWLAGCHSDRRWKHSRLIQSKQTPPSGKTLCRTIAAARAIGNLSPRLGKELWSKRAPSVFCSINQAYTNHSGIIKCYFGQHRLISLPEWMLMLLHIFSKFKTSEPFVSTFSISI